MAEPRNEAETIESMMARAQEEFQALTMGQLGLVYLDEFDHSYRGKKAGLIRELMDHFSFKKNRDSFITWLGKKPEWQRRVLTRAAWEGYLPTAELEKDYGVRLLVKTRNQGYYAQLSIDPSHRMHLLQPLSQHILALYPPFLRILRFWLDKPEGYTYQATSEPTEPGWRLGDSLAESLPLLLRKLHQERGETYEEQRLIEKGLGKPLQKRWAKDCQLPDFPLGGRYGTSPTDLLARFFALLYPEGLLVESDSYETIKAALARFLEPQAVQIRELGAGRHPGMFEFLVFAAYLYRDPKFRTISFPKEPPARRLFKEIIMDVARDGGWFSASDICRSLSLQLRPLTYTEASQGSNLLYVKAYELRIGDLSFSSDYYYRRIEISSLLVEPAVYAPLFRAYCYLFAALGLLEISESSPPMMDFGQERSKPLSPYDCLDRLRITQLGRWCLGLGEKPTLPERRFEAIADERLLLVSLRGRSLEHRAYLERIGTPLGSDRFRINAGSFLRGCSRTKDIDASIAEFKRLICKQPAPHWLDFFAQLRARSCLFTHPQAYLAFELPDDPAVARLFTEDPVLRAMTIRAEGRRVLVEPAKHKRFLAALSEHGFFNEPD